jgi:hypothetical protein
MTETAPALEGRRTGPAAVAALTTLITVAT